MVDTMGQSTTANEHPHCGTKHIMFVSMHTQHCMTTIWIIQGGMTTIWLHGPRADENFVLSFTMLPLWLVVHPGWLLQGLSLVGHIGLIITDSVV